MSRVQLNFKRVVCANALLLLTGTTVCSVSYRLHAQPPQQAEIRFANPDERRLGEFDKKIDRLQDDSRTSDKSIAVLQAAIVQLVKQREEDHTDLTRLTSLMIQLMYGIIFALLTLSGANIYLVRAGKKEDQRGAQRTR